MTDLTAEIAAELEAEDAKEAAALAERQRERRAALVPAMTLSRQIQEARAKFLADDRARVDELATLIKDARRSGAPKARLDSLAVKPMVATVGKQRAPRRPKPSAAAPSTSETIAPLPSAPETVHNSDHRVAV